MRRLPLFFVVSTFGLMHLACSDSSTTNSKDAGTAKGGAGGNAQTSTGGSTGMAMGGAADAASGGAGGLGTGGNTGVALDAALDAVADAALDAPAVDAAMGDVRVVDAGGGEAGLTGPAARGEYLVRNVLGCVSCHTPRVGGTLDNSKLLSGVECFAKDTDGGCLNSANLTNDSTGLKDLSDEQIKNAIIKGIAPEDGPDGGMQFLFAQMPYYQFADLSDDDASAIVAYLRTVPAISHQAANTGSFVKQPSMAEWAPVALKDLPSATAMDGGSASATNGKYLASLACATCHTLNTAATSPLQLDASKAFQGGKKFTTTIAGADGGSTSKDIQSLNLTPDSTGIKGWTPGQIVTAIKSGKDDGGRTLCSPMRTLPGITDQDATDIANYLLGLPPVANPNITMTCQ